MLEESQVFTSLASIASMEVVSVSNIDSPTEFNSIAGSVAGERRIAVQVGAADDVYTIYLWEAANSGGVDAPYVMAGSSGFWVAVAGKYVNSDARFGGALLTRGLLTVNSDTDGTTILGRSKVGSPSTDQAVFAHFDRLSTTEFALRQDSSGGTTVNVASGQTLEFAVAGTTRISMTATGFNVTSGLTFSVANTTAATSPTAAAFTCAGGIAASGAVYIGGQFRTDATGTVVRSTGATTSYRSFQVNNTGGDFYYGIESSVGGAVFTGTAAYDSVVYATTPRLYYYALAHHFASLGAVTVANTTASTSTTTGSLINSGGFANAGIAYFGGTEPSVPGATEVTIGGGFIKCGQSIRCHKNGSDSIGSGAIAYLANVANDRVVAWQLSGSNHADLWQFNGTSWQTMARFARTTTAGETTLLLYDVDNATLERVTVGAADSGGAGFKVLRIPN